MASLDDFFARKDKRKSKAKPKFVTPEELVKKLEEAKKEAALAGGMTEEDEEEWRDFEQEQRKDYSGLKIAQLTINDDEFVDVDEEISENNSNVESIKISPWKKLIPAEVVTQIPVEIAQEKTSKIYISPALRQSQLQGITSVGGGIRSTRNLTAPDITNADFFPTLSAARREEQRKKKNQPAFEEARHGGRVQRVQNQLVATAPTAASNRFQSLYDVEEER